MDNEQDLERASKPVGQDLVRLEDKAETQRENITTLQLKGRTMACQNV